MTFLAPLFLLGALAVIGPLVFHLIRRTTREVTPFSTLMFLQPSPPRITKRSRLENILLLLLRCAVIALLALAFARPFFREASRTPLAPGREGKRQVLLVDTSASMRRGKQLWDDTRVAVAARLKEAAPADDLAIVSFDAKPREVVSFEDWRKAPVEQRAALAQQRLAATTPGFAATRLDAALIRAAELLDQPLSTELPAKSEIVVFSDFQEGASLDALQGFAWPERVSVLLSMVHPTDAENAGLAWLPEAESVSSAGQQNEFRLRVSNSNESKKEQFTLRWMAGTAGAEFPAYVPAGKTRMVRAPKPPASADRVLLTGDSADFDNTVFVLPPQARKVPVLFVGTDADEDPTGSLYYLLRAFPRTSKQEVQITAHRAPGRIPEFQLQQAQLLVIGSGASEAALAGVRDFIAGGKIALIPIASAADAQNVARLAGVESLPSNEAKVRDYAMLAQIDFQHPLFAPFADPRFSDFTKIHFWRHRHLDISGLKDARVLARFDDGDPALVQLPLERGSILLLATTWRPSDSQLALSSKFLPLLQSILEQSSQLPPTQAQYFVGDEIPLPPGSTALTVRKPDGSEVSTAAGGRFTAADQPGIYQVNPGGMKFVVNLAPEESRTSPLGPERLTALGVPLARENAATAHDPKRDARTQAAELENRQKLWRWALIACLVTALVETLIAAKISREAGAKVSPSA